MAEKTVEIPVRVGSPDQLDQIARLTRDVSSRLQIETGDSIEISGRYIVPALAEIAETKGAGIYLSRALRMNLGILEHASETVRVRRCSLASAKTIKLAPEKGANVEGMEKRLLESWRGMPVRGGMTLKYSTHFSSIAFKAVETDPQGNVMIGERTQVILVKAEDIYTEPPVIQETTKREIIRNIIEPLRNPQVYSQLGLKPPKGIILYGPPGTGKTMIAKWIKQVVSAHFELVTREDIVSGIVGETEKKLQEVFDRAEERRPSILFIDEIDALAPSREASRGGVETVSVLLTNMDGLKDQTRVVVIGATNRIDAIDSALRRPGRFDREIEIGVPDREARSLILRQKTKGMRLAPETDVEDIASRTHGYVGADIDLLCREAAMTCIDRYASKERDSSGIISQEDLQKMQVTQDDFVDAMNKIRPSGMREFFSEIPDVKWDDVGGMEKAKQALREAVGFTLNPEMFRGTTLSPPKGVLLYGPPGTGKTMLAKAAASTFDANFISVKGPELLQMWVGESERGVRRLFGRAKRVAPCITFIDEIDALAPARGAIGDSDVMNRVVAQLLTELDGVESLGRVVIMGATNRPDILDPALLRPGRFDRLIYTPPPDQETRWRILEIKTKGLRLSADLDLKKIAEETKDYSGADLENLIRGAYVLALRSAGVLGGDPRTWKTRVEKPEITQAHVEAALGETGPGLTPKMAEGYERFADRYQRREVAGE